MVKVTDICDSFRTINYLVLVISVRQPLRKHSPSIFLSAHTQSDDLQTLLFLVQ
jgi:hypothetical protein